MKRFTPEEDALIRDYTAAGRSMADAAKALERREASVRSRRKLLGLKTTPEERLAIRQAAGAKKRGRKLRPHRPECRARKSAVMVERWRGESGERARARLEERRAALLADPARRAAWAAAVKEAKWAWCPEPFREDYRLLRKKTIPATEARAIMQPRIDAWLRTFEGQLWKVKTGRARVVPALRLSRPVGTPFSLAGGSL
jgi:hypothetical protein